MKHALSLKVTPVWGGSQNEAVIDGCELAARLGLAYVSFESNDYSFVCRSDWQATKFKTDVSVSKPSGRYGKKDVRTDKEWKFYPPIQPAIHPVDE